MSLIPGRSIGCGENPSRHTTFEADMAVNVRFGNEMIFLNISQNLYSIPSTHNYQPDPLQWAVKPSYVYGLTRILNEEKNRPYAEGNFRRTISFIGWLLVGGTKTLEKLICTSKAYPK